MTESIATPLRIGIAGYGNLGKGVASAVGQNPDMTLQAIFTRRDPASLDVPAGLAPVHPWADLPAHRDEIDVLILCGGSKEDLPTQGPELAAHFTTVDSFDTHARIPEYFAAVDAPARAAGTTAIISVGWDPGMFSLNRLFGEALLPQGQTYSFWGKGLSQGHSDAVRRVPGVAAGVQYTIPATDAIEAVRRGERPELSTRDKHRREAYVVLAEGADAAEVEQAIVTMPHYFADYDTTVHFISAEELARDHATMPHGGFVIRSGTTGTGGGGSSEMPDGGGAVGSSEMPDGGGAVRSAEVPDGEGAAGSTNVPADGGAGGGHSQVIEYRLELGSNPEFTASVLVAYARAAARLNAQGIVGAQSVLDVPPGLLSPKPAEQLRAELL